MEETVDREATTVPADEMDVNREARTVESDEVDRNIVTYESDDVCNRDAATVECPPKVVFAIEPPLKESLLKGIPAVPVQRKLHQPLIFGRANGVDIFLNDDQASRQHMKLFVPSGVTTQESPFVVETISGSQPVYINGQSLRKSEQRLLQTGDKLKIAQLAFTVQIESGDSPLGYEVEFIQQPVSYNGVPNGSAPRMANVKPQLTFPANTGLASPSMSFARGVSAPQPPSGQFSSVQPHIPQQPRYTPISPGAEERRAVFHVHKHPSENSDQQGEKASVRVPVQETFPHQ